MDEIRSKGPASNAEQLKSKFAEQDDEHTRYLHSGNPDLTDRPLFALALDSSYRIRCRVAEHRNTPLGLLEFLAMDKHPEVRVCVAENRNSTLALIERLACDDCPDVRYAIAENACTPGFILLALSKDENPYVSFRAIKTICDVLPRTSLTGRVRVLPQAEKKLRLG